MKVFLEKYGLIVAVAVSLVGLGAVVVGAYHEFVTIARYEREAEAQRMELAGVSLNQQQISARQNIKWFEQELRDFYRKHGQPPYHDPDTQARYERIKRDLQDERDLLNDLRQKVKK